MGLIKWRIEFFLTCINNMLKQRSICFVQKLILLLTAEYIVSNFPEKNWILSANTGFDYSIHRDIRVDDLYLTRIQLFHNFIKINHLNGKPYPRV